MKEDGELHLTKKQRRSSLVAPFWDTHAEVDKNSKFFKEIEKISKGMRFVPREVEELTKEYEKKFGKKPRRFNYMEEKYSEYEDFLREKLKKK